MATSIRTSVDPQLAAIFCHGPLLHAVQSAHIFPDSKTFVDMSLKDEPEVG